MATLSEKKLTEEQCLELIEAIANDLSIDDYPTKSFKDLDLGIKVLKLSNADQASLVVEMMRWQPKVKLQDLTNIQDARQLYFAENQNLEALRARDEQHERVSVAMLQIVNRNLPLSREQVAEAIQHFYLHYGVDWQKNKAKIKNLIQRFARENEVTLELKQLIDKTCNRIEKNRYLGAQQYAACIRKALKIERYENPISSGEAWSDNAIQSIANLDVATEGQWIQLISLCSSASGGKPSSKWLKSAIAQRNQLGLELFNTSLLCWLPAVDQPRTQPLPEPWRSELDLIHDQNANILKGLVWLCADQTDPNLTRAISALAISAYRKVPNIGPRCVKLGNACVWTLGQMPCEEAVAQLALLKAKVKFGSAQIGIEKALTAAAARLGISRDEIEELSIPTYGLTGGLTEVGIRRETFTTEAGDYTAELKITGTSSTALTWLKPDGKPQKSVPKAVKDNYADELKALKQAAKDIQKMLPAQRDRIDNLFLAQKTWDYDTWRDRYLNHPLIGSLARRIIWQFTSPDGNHSAGIWINGGTSEQATGAICDRQLNPIPWLETHPGDAEITVQLWHPISASTKAIQDWRELLLNQQIQQPFKQAHRELYLLTAAEETTQIYSNRFAAHILKQHQFNALAKQRGWKNQLRLMVDDAYEPARRILENWGLRAEFWIEGIGDNYGTDTTEAGTYLHLSTDQVRFYSTATTPNYAHAGGGGYGDRYGNGTAPTPLPLTEIPALVFSEILRDVDLFVGISSIGNDPNWIDGGTEGHRHDYWHSYSFGDLTATANTRREVLKSLIPRLKIKDRCSFQDKFLVVRGDLRTYKIHLGSGNILMEPNDQYLCIVPGRSNTGPGSKVFLPFEGDRVMAIILSKAFLLAADTQIKDETILHQIR